MELCTARTTISAFLPHPRLLSANPNHLRPRPRPSLPLKRTSISRTSPGFLYYANSSLRSTSEETSTANEYAGEESDSAIAVKDAPSVEKDSNGGNFRKEVSNEDSTVGDQAQLFEFFDNFDVKLDSEDSYSYLVIGGGAIVTLWVLGAIVGAIDAIPVFPKLMEVVGLGYTLWFSTRYLIFKENREELVAKIEEIKQQVLGSGDD